MSESKERREFRIPVSTGIFSHRRRLREAHWLFLYYIDRTTGEFTNAGGRRLGQVLYGRPCLDSDAASAFGCCTRTIARWRNLLAKLGYTAQKWTGRGWMISVNKSKKWDWKGTQSKSPSAQNCPVRSYTTVHSDRTILSTQKSGISPQIAQNQALTDEVESPTEQYRTVQNNKPGATHISHAQQNGGKGTPERAKTASEELDLLTVEGLLRRRAEFVLDGSVFMLPWIDKQIAEAREREAVARVEVGKRAKARTSSNRKGGGRGPK